METYTLQTPTYNKDFLDGLNKYISNFKDVTFTKKTTNSLKLKKKDDGLNGLRNFVTDLNNGDLEKNSMSEEEFFNEIKKW
jgi:hypothetical protein